GRAVATTSFDGSLRLWEALTGKERAQLQPNDPRGFAQAVAFSPDGRLLATASGNAGIRVLDVLDAGGQGRLVNGNQGYLASLAFSGDGRLLVSRSQDGTLLVWDAARLRPEQKVKPATWTAAEADR